MLLKEIIKQLTLVTQLGLELISPLLLCLGICWWLTSRFSLGGWVYIPGFFFGLGGSWAVAAKLYNATVHRENKEKKEKKRPLSFNRHD